MATHRPTPSSSISYPRPSLERSQSPPKHAQRPPSPPKTPPKRRQPSLSNIHPMNWLSRGSSSGSTHSTGAPQQASKPVRISEPKLSNGFDLSAPSHGALGLGATIVRTPQEALAGSRIQVSYMELEDSDTGHSDDIYGEIEEEEEGNDTLPSPPSSPPLPPLPLFAKSSPHLPMRETLSHPPAPSRPPPPAPAESASARPRPSLKPISPPSSEYNPPVPPLPPHLSSSPPQPPFEAILVSSLPSSTIDPSKIIVTLETCTATHRTTFSTLTSRPSSLATYLQSLLPDSDRSSLHSTHSDADSSFNSIFHHHLTASGLLSQSSSSIHIFLDRPSASYAHILNYLRSPSSSPILPRAVQLLPSLPRHEASSRLDLLLELRDEARYLGLEELYKLCTEEIRLRQSFSLPNYTHTHRRGGSNTSANGTSIHSVQTLVMSTGSREKSIERTDSSESKESRYSSNTTASAAAKSPGATVAASDPVPAAVSPGLREQLALRTSSEVRKEGYATLRSRPTAEWI
ncbi:hypothetical protein JAAARDRAFT_28201 [Jaapia argillacea MUCL 33604]|uniref:BTB domain-containing protein n=1 Tax=Jaapia argillacea MUCL 33604 TaxID=933084 RepID=A0A067QPJ3_9AGAM|nr:hypothetical protein JAAARDRAFT_28201 [Jaapia argillacea MUCL 33604]